MSASSSSPDERSFTVEASSIDVTGGRYINDEPVKAARKAANQMFSSPAGQKQSVIKVQLRETTRGSGDNLYAYQAEKKRIDKTVRIKGQDVTFRKRLTLHSIPLFHGDGATRKQSKASKANKSNKTSKK